MAEFQVTAATLKSKAEELRTLNDNFAKKTEELMTAKAKLDSTWEGDSKQAFTNAVNADKAKMDVFKSTVDDCYARLLTIIAQYEKAENEAVSIANTRKI